ncbi:ABC transporter substrate-binding protein [Microvirga sp. 2MCAF38]|uniref:ABC transporter substrate-binding protein n=1 Tax=Microvirga sp. 2MCAF38 TaxID=3232989 RepID=UPI003F987C79
MKRLILAALLACSSSAAAMAADSGPFKGQGAIVFCTEFGDPPAAFLDKDGQTPIGFEIDLMKAIGNRLGVKTELKNFKFASIFAALDSGQCDAVMSQTSKSPERLQIYDFVDYRAQASGILVKKGNPLNLHTYEDLSGRRVAVLLGSANERRLKAVNEKIVSANKSPMEIATYQNNAIAFQDLSLGRVEAFASGSLTLAYFLSTATDKFEIGGLPIPPNTMGIVIPKAQAAKTKAIGDTWKELVASGEAQKILDDWKLGEGTFLCGSTKACD